MSEIVTAARTGCGCSENRFRALVTVPAGSVPSGLAACGITSELAKLPVTYIREQGYREGFCPNDALEAGTLFPELADEYR